MRSERGLDEPETAFLHSPPIWPAMMLVGLVAAPTTHTSADELVIHTHVHPLHRHVVVVLPEQIHMVFRIHQADFEPLTQRTDSRDDFALTNQVSLLGVQQETVSEGRLDRRSFQNATEPRIMDSGFPLRVELPLPDDEVDVPDVRLIENHVVQSKLRRLTNGLILNIENLTIQRMTHWFSNRPFDAPKPV